MGYPRYSLLTFILCVCNIICKQHHISISSHFLQHHMSALFVSANFVFSYYYCRTFYYSISGTSAASLVHSFSCVQQFTSMHFSLCIVIMFSSWSHLMQASAGHMICSITFLQHYMSASSHIHRLPIYLVITLLFKCCSMIIFYFKNFCSITSSRWKALDWWKHSNQVL